MSGLRHPAQAVVAVLAAATLSGCLCGPSMQDKVNTLQAQNAALKFQVDATEKANTASREYAGELKGAPAEPIFSMHYTKNDLAVMAANTVPYRIDAREFNNDVSGEIVVDSLSEFAFHPGNRVTCRMRMHGERIEYHGSVPGAYQKMVEDFKAGIAAGVIVDLDSSVTFVGNTVRVLPHVTAAHMLRNGSDLFESNLRDQMNQRAFRDPVDFGVSIAGKNAALKRMVITGNDLVLSYVAH
ncbi:MAG TPA: hypothetical protein VMV18_08145 [bacterium]|nr:hypothetical protein [bacterium]